MHDPYRKKLDGLLSIKAVFKIEDKEEEIKIFHLSDKEYVAQNTPEILQKEAFEAMKQVSPGAVSSITNTNVRFSYENDDALKSFDFGNTLVEVRLPYCLLIPNRYEMKVNLPEMEMDTLVTFEKVWTNRATFENVSSDEADFFADDRILYFQHSSITTPKMPIDPLEGWEPFFHGKNVEKTNDNNGTFRYTRLYIQFTTEIVNGENDRLRSAIDISNIVINRIIDNYRDVTGESHIRRLGQVNPILIYFIDQNYGEWLLPLNIGTARMNISRVNLEQIKKRLNDGTQPGLHQLLFMNAQNSLDKGDLTLAVVESFQALEIFLENYLIAQFQKIGVFNDEYVKILNKNWKTKNRLRDVLKITNGISLIDNNELWDKWCTSYDKIRNEVIHSGKEPTVKEAFNVLNTNNEVFTWISAL